MIKILKNLAFVCALGVVLGSCSSISDTEFEVNGVKFKMIAVEGGSFMMGATLGQGKDVCENEKPAHKVIVDDFMIGETEVTQELWFAVMGNNPSYFKSSEENLPVENVSWNDVQGFIKKLNEITGQQFRLPYEVEWEYAARGGKKSTDKKYAGSDDVNEVAWYQDNAGGKTHAVATKKANELGIYDMSGNVYEWCMDFCSVYDSNVCKMRSGSYSNSSEIVRVSFRHSLNVYSRGEYLGFRLALH
ncbi:MAG: formylglycine-generating enzyme family protein [Bacteroidales bacterium]|nr:formylglycine-generating enzyme family protein [Bacteroidales bacterium]